MILGEWRLTERTYWQASNYFKLLKKEMAEVCSEEKGKNLTELRKKSEPEDGLVKAKLRQTGSG